MSIKELFDYIFSSVTCEDIRERLFHVEESALIDSDNLILMLTILCLSESAPNTHKAYALMTISNIFEKTKFPYIKDILTIIIINNKLNDPIIKFIGFFFDDFSNPLQLYDINLMNDFLELLGLGRPLQSEDHTEIRGQQFNTPSSTEN